MQPFDVRLPARRITDLVTTEAGSDLLVYDQKTAAIHTLNDVTAKVWRALDTEKPLSVVMSDTGLTEDVVRSAVTKLADAELLDATLASEARTSQSRREFMRKAAIGGAVAVPMLISTTAPQAASASSHCSGCSHAFLSLELGLTEEEIQARVLAFLFTLGTPRCTPRDCGRCRSYDIDVVTGETSIEITIYRRCSSSDLMSESALASSAEMQARSQMSDESVFGSEGGDTGSEGGDTGSEGGDTGSEGGDTGSEGGDTGSEGGDTGSEGGDTGSEGGEEDGVG